VVFADNEASIPTPLCISHRKKDGAYCICSCNRNGYGHGLDPMRLTRLRLIFRCDIPILLDLGRSSVRSGTINGLSLATGVSLVRSSISVLDSVLCVEFRLWGRTEVGIRNVEEVCSVSQTSVSEERGRWHTVAAGPPPLPCSGHSSHVFRQP
jgi:hypothetical protein